MKTLTRNWPMAAFHVEWIVLFLIFLLGWLVISPQNQWITPVTGIYALFFAAGAYLLIRLMHDWPGKQTPTRTHA